MTEPARKSPPFAKQIDPNDDLTMIYCGSRAWDLSAPAVHPGGDRVASLAYPRDADPAIYRWPVKNKSVLVVAGDEDVQKVRLLVVELLRQGALVVHLYIGEQLVTYERPAP